MTMPDASEIEALVGHEFPGGKYTVAHWENFLLTECTGGEQLPEGMVHPVVMFHMPILGAGTSIADMFALGQAESDYSIGIESYDWEFFGTLEEDVEYSISARVTEAGHHLVVRQIVTDDFSAITGQIGLWIDDPAVDVVVTTGGTGLTGRDGTPEALRNLFDKEIEGFGELFRYISYAKIGTSTIQSRAVAGVAGGTYIFALPGSPSACRDGWDEILRYQLDIRHRPCNFVEIMPRLTESPTTRRGG